MSEMERWKELSPYLDLALDLSEEERPVWIASMLERNPDLGCLLKSFLEDQDELDDEAFLLEDAVGIAHFGLAGHRIGPYKLLSSLGQGGMGSVWLAERADGRFERKVAIKFLNLALSGRVGEKRFHREGNVLGRLIHPHIGELIDAGVSESGHPYLILEFIEGEHIDSYCDRQALDVKARVRLFLEVLDAVSYAHHNLIVHRDIKPSNVLVNRQGQAKLLDFGIAKLLEQDENGTRNSLLTVETSSPLTPAYAAPEQLTGGSVTTSTDVYALGALLYVLLTGQHPAGRSICSHSELVKAILERDPALPSDVVLTGDLDQDAADTRRTTRHKLRKILSGDLDTIVMTALKKEPHERYSSASAMADDLRRYLKCEPIKARRESIPYRAIKFVRRKRLVVSLGTLALLGTLSGFIGTVLQAQKARSERDFVLRQMTRTAAVNEFHNFLLSDAAPSAKPVSVSELLKRAEKIVERQHTATDPNRVELMLSIGRQYLEQDDAVDSRRVLNHAYRLSLGLTDPAIRAEASCTLASSLARDEELSRAEQLLQEGLRILPKDSQFAMERIGCLQNGFEVSEERQEVWRGISFAEAAQKALRASPFDSEAQELHRWLDLGTAYGAAGRDMAALNAFQHAGRLLSSLGRDETATAAALFNGWGLKQEQMGRPLEAERSYRRAMDINHTTEKDEAVSPVLLNNYARSLRELGQLDQAARYAERAYREAENLQQQMVINQSLFERARIYAAQRKLSDATTMLAAVRPRLRKTFPPGHYAFATLAIDQALVAALKGDTGSALALAEQAIALDEQAVRAGRDGAFHLSILLERKAAIELEAKRPDLAYTDADRALRRMESATGTVTFSSFRGHAYLTLGHALASQGRHAEAQRAFKLAAEQLRNSVGQDYPDTQAATQLAGR